MTIPWALLLLVGGLVILWKAADVLVAGAVGLAGRLGISPLIIGLTVVAMGTSAPEAAASIAAVLQGKGDIAIGNVFGSNIANLALVGGVIALISPLVVRRQTLMREIPAMLVITGLLYPVLRNTQVARWEGTMLLGLFALLLLATAIGAKRGKWQPAVETRKGGPVARSLPANVMFVALGLVGLALGAKMTVDGAVVIGKAVGLTDAVIGLTIVAIGTSLPELATCVVAALKGQHDISVGNLVGSNIFNALLVTGTAATVRPFHIGSTLIRVEYWIVLAVSVGFAVLVLVGRKTISRLSGALLVCVYVAYLAYLFISKPGT